MARSFSTGAGSEATGAGRRGPRPSLDLAAIGRAALRVADTEGLEGVTVRRLASELGVGVMTLYGYVRTKDEILDQLTDLAFGELELPTVGSWDEQLEELFLGLHGLLIAHPSVAYLHSVRPLTGRGGLGVSDRVLGLLSAGGLADEEAFAAQRALTSYTVGAALFHIRSRRGDQETSLERRGQLRVLADEYPNVRAHLARFEAEGAPEELRRECQYGLSHLLMGIRADANQSRRRAEGHR